MIREHAAIPKARRWVVKIGSSLLTEDGKGLSRKAMARWVTQFEALREQGIELVLVSSGAIAAGMESLGWQERPESLDQQQAAAAVGQMRLAQAWEDIFQIFGSQTAQVLLTHEDLSDRGRYLNGRSTLRALLSHKVVPIINENDTVVTDEIRFGDNDTLAALVANLLDADLLVILTDQTGLFKEDPRKNPNAELIQQAAADDNTLDAMVGDAGRLGRGGMITKLRAARLAARSGATTVIACGKQDKIIEQLSQGQRQGTLLWSGREREVARKQWLAGQLRMNGKLQLDDGAVKVLKQSGRSLLAVGVRGVEGVFRRGELVACVDTQGREVARGLVNYSSEDVKKIQGKASSDISKVLGFMSDEELIHRDNLVLL
ncbi:glutamate 5-kinase [Pelagibaculum spongiae]|uniref:Glutamate 5-kinase n=1 Tax=Pelagibaculum spongiae TaxID=2080658 RepID=A0A2V1H2Q9_9GAMM|nr:glutamate 5-kinase [Pelagibaculum spongiae]PVZ70691.1 glutamate 5-kinase [Pelagibaculum spongiae]